MIPIIILAIESPEDREYMTHLYLEYERLMYWEINKYVENKWDAEDILQTVLVKLIDKISELKEKDTNKRSAYILATCRNTSINFLKKHNRITEFEFEFHDFDGVETDSNSPEDFVVQKDEYDILYAAWKLLDRKTMYLLEAKYVLEKPTKEIANDLGVQQNCVRAHLSRARGKLKKKFDLVLQQPASLSQPRSPFQQLQSIS